jgi:hypothetical protein
MLTAATEQRCCNDSLTPCRWAFLRNDQQPHWMRTTTLETHNYAGWRIVPRAPTEIYYCECVQMEITSTTPCSNCLSTAM